MKVSYFPGCTLRTKAKELDRWARESALALGVEPAKLIEAVRLLAIREKGANHLKADDSPALADEELPQQAVVSALRKYSK